MAFFRKNAPAPVLPEGGAENRRALQKTTNFDIEEFLAEQTVEALFSTPLGPTGQCLNVDQAAGAAAGNLDEVIASHLSDCGDCQEQVRTYRLLAGTDFTDATHGVDISNYIRVPAGKELYLIVFNRGNVLELSEIDPASVEVSGVIDGKVRSIEPLDPKQFNAEEAVAVYFETFTLNVPESGELEDYLCLEAKTKAGRFRRRRMVHLIDEAKMQAAETAGI